MAGLGAVRIGQALNSPEFALLRGDPRVKALRKKVGLPDGFGSKADSPAQPQFCYGRVLGPVAPLIYGATGGKLGVSPRVMI